MATFFRRLAKAAPIAFGGHTKPASRTRFGALAAISGGISAYYFYCLPDMGDLKHSGILPITVLLSHFVRRVGMSWLMPNQGYLDQIKEEAGPKYALNPDKWIEFKLQEKAQASHNTQLFRFSFDPDAKLGLHVASCIITRAPNGQNAEGKTKYVIRPYTPISDPDAKGYFDLLIKVYPEGKMSQHFASLKPGDVVEMKGPIEKFRYSPNMKKHIGMIAGGSGITPMLQVIDAILKNPDDNTQVSLLYANVSPDDILLKKKLDILAASNPNLKVFYTVDNPTKDWLGGQGYISKEVAVKGLPSPGDDSLILVCGPPGMMKHISGEKKDRAQGELSGILKELGYTEDMVYKF